MHLRIIAVELLIACVAIWTLPQVGGWATAQSDDNGLRPRVARRHAPGIQEINYNRVFQTANVCPLSSRVPHQTPSLRETVRKKNDKAAIHFGFPKKLVIFVLPFTGDTRLGFFVLGDFIFDFEGVTELLVFLLGDGEPAVCCALTLTELRVLSW